MFQTPSPPVPSSTLVAPLELALVELGLAVTVLSTLVVEGPVTLVEGVTLVCIVVTLVSGPPGSELDNAEDADAADEAAEDAEDAADVLPLAVMETEGDAEREERDRDGDTRDTEVEAEGRREESEEGMDTVVRGSVTEAVMLLASELPTEEIIERGLDEAMLSGSVSDGAVAEAVAVWSSVDVVRSTPVAVRRSVSVICRATRLAASTSRRPSGAAKTTAAEQRHRSISETAEDHESRRTSTGDQSRDEKHLVHHDDYTMSIQLPK